MADNTKKTFVLDTNVILHDYNCINNFEDNDVVIPIVVLEELDMFKKGNELINLHAREFARMLDKLSGNSLFNGGIKIGEGAGFLKIEINTDFSERMNSAFPTHTPDHRILSVAEKLHFDKKVPNVVLITKDINLRMKAKAVGVMSQDYMNDNVKDIETLTRDVNEITNVPDDVINELYRSPDGIECSKLGVKYEYNDFAILKGTNSSALSYINSDQKRCFRVEKHHAYGIEPRNAEQTFTLSALLNSDIQLVAITGKAGTGKTLLALAAALQQEEQFSKIYLARPIVPLSNKDIGFLPGDVNDKIAPYTQPLFDNLSVIKHKFRQHSKEYIRIEELIKEEKLVIAPLAYIRGRSLSETFFIIDEAQNLTPHEIKTIITRAGEGTKVVFTGDIHQIDSPYLDIKSNGLSYLTDKMKGQKLFAHVNLVKGERSELAELASNLL